MNSRIDLHIHTAASDGSDTIPELLQKIQAAGLNTFSITDHDTIAGALEMAQLAPRELCYIPGIEFSCTTSFRKCHILGYGFDSGDSLLLDTLELGKSLRQEKLHRRVAFLKTAFGIILTPEEARWLYGQRSPGKPHFGKLIVDRGLAPDLETAIKTYVNPCKTGNDRIHAADAVRAILHAGGIPVWAHPLGGEGEKRLTHEEFQMQLEELLACGIRGLECHYSRYCAEDIAFLTEQAQIRNLLISGGSDYHGSNKVGLRLGQLNDENSPVDPGCLTLCSHFRKQK